MITVLTLYWYSLKVYTRDLKAWLLMLGGPAAVILLVGYGLAPRLETNSLVSPFSVAVVDKEDSLETRTLIHHFETTPALRDMVTVQLMGMEEASAMLRHNQVAAAIVIPEGFVWNMERGRNLPFTVIGNPRRPLQSAMIRQMMQSAASLVTAAQSGVNTVMQFAADRGSSGRESHDRFGQAVTDFTLQSLGRNDLLTTTTISATGESSASQYYGIALGTALTQFAGLSLLWSARESERGLLLRMRALRLSPHYVVAARFLSLATCQLLQLALIYGLISVLFPWHGSANVPLLIASGGAIAAAQAGMLLLISAAAPNQTALNLIGITVVLACALIGGSLLPTPYLPPFIAKLHSLSPTHWALNSVTTAAFNGPAVEALRSVALLIGMAALCLIASAVCLKRVGR